MSKTNAVQVESAEQEPTCVAPAGALREQAAERLAAHRERRLRVAPEQRASGAGPRAVAAGAGRSERIATAVAERYAQTQSYRSFLAAEAENSVRLAQAAAQVAARNVEALAAARQVLLQELEAIVPAETPPEPRLQVPPPVEMVSPLSSPDSRSPWRSPEEVSNPPLADHEEPHPADPAVKSTAGGLTVRLYEDAGRSAREAADHAAEKARRAADALTPRSSGSFFDPRVEDEGRMLDEEIAYRQSPMEDLAQPSVAIPGNLLEFPRQLVAARKARPRYAEGPLREEADAPDSQLRIFEVEAVRTESPIESSSPEWSSIWLDALAAETPEGPAVEAEYPMAQRPYTAKPSLRVMAALVDGCLIGGAYVLFATVFVYRAAALPGLALAAGGSVVLLASLYLMYQMLFFTLDEATPGMRYARIGLCTFADDNPTRAAMRRRVLAEMLAACPLGLGLLWACVDDDRLGWHDRISRMYPRAY